MMKKKCLLVHNNLYSFGGAELFAIRAINTLMRAGYDVDVVHCGAALNVKALSDWSGIAIDENRLKVIRAFPFIQALIKSRKVSLLRYALALRAAKRYVSQYDLVVSSYGELTVSGKKNFQFIHVPIFFHDAESLSYLGEQAHKLSRRVARMVYVQSCRLISGWSRQHVEKIPALANSKWTMGQVVRHYPGVAVDYTYMGAKTEQCFTDDVLGTWWSERRDTVVVLGRVVPGKRIELAIEFTKRIRERGIAINLLIIGRADAAYAADIKKLIADKSYVEWKQGLNREQLEGTISSCKWGLHCSLFEHYGISALELQRLGCLTIVPNSCGQAELVEDARFSYQDIDDLVEKFSAVYLDENLQATLNLHRTKKVLEHNFMQHDEYMFNYINALEN